MAGGTTEHGALALAVAGELRAALRGKPCRTFSSDVRVRIGETGLTTYPDLSVACGRLETAPDDGDAITSPSTSRSCTRTRWGRAARRRSY
jgi:Uma2 family endonuclease